MKLLELANDWLRQANQLLTELPANIYHLDWRVAALLVPLGVVSLLYGYRVFKGVVVIYCSVAGAAVGWWIAAEALHRPDFWWLGVLVGGIVMAVVAWPLVNFFVGFWGAVAGGLAACAVAHAVGEQRLVLLAVAVGVVVGALLATMIFRIMVILTTSVVGAHMAVVGLVALLSRIDEVAGPLSRTLNSANYMLPLVVAAPAVFGIVYQLYRSEGREKKPAPAERKE